MTCKVLVSILCCCPHDDSSYDSKGNRHEVREWVLCNLLYRLVKKLHPEYGGGRVMISAVTHSSHRQTAGRQDIRDSQTQKP